MICLINIFNSGWIFTTKRVVAVIGSPHKGSNYDIVKQFERKLKDMWMGKL